jgi:hypothetical protein
MWKLYKRRHLLPFVAKQKEVENEIAYFLIQVFLYDAQLKFLIIRLSGFCDIYMSCVNMIIASLSYAMLLFVAK